MATEVINHLQQLPLALILIFNLKIMKQIIYVFLLTVLSSCDSYLSKVPSPSTSAPINNVEQLVAIYDNATAFINETNPFACYSNDDADLTAELYKADPSAFAISSTVFIIYCIQQGLLHRLRMVYGMESIQIFLKLIP